MQAFIDLWKGFRLLPSAWLLLMQFFILVLSLLSHHATYRVLIWMLGVCLCLQYLPDTGSFQFLSSDPAGFAKLAGSTVSEFQSAVCHRPV